VFSSSTEQTEAHQIRELENSLAGHLSEERQGTFVVVGSSKPALCEVDATNCEGIDSLQAMAAPEVAGGIDVEDAPAVDARPTRSISVGRRTYPLVLPNPRDVRLHVAAVVVSIHVLGQVALGFRVSVPQILTAIGTCFVIEVLVVFARERRFVWPASAMLTGSGVALILRVPSTKSGAHWSFNHLGIYAAVAALSLATKYVIRWRGLQVFNPSNVGLVGAFVVLGRSRVDPLSFWWGGPSVGTVLAYGLIVVGGLRVGRRMRMLGLLAGFWLTLAAGLAVMAGTGHCMSTPWSIPLVCGPHFWWTVAFSPELLIFVFFMISDPKTVPTSPQARIRYGIFVGMVCGIFMAPQSTEFGTKVALLAGLTLCSVLRLFEARVFWNGAVDLDPFRRPPAGPVASRSERSDRVAKAAVNAVTFVLLVLFLSRNTHGEAVVSAAGLPSVSGLVAASDMPTLPRVIVTADALALDERVHGDGAQRVADQLAWDLAVESAIAVRGDSSLYAAVDHGNRLAQMTTRLERASMWSDGSWATEARPMLGGAVAFRSYTFTSLRLIVERTSGQGTGSESRLAFDGIGTYTDSFRGSRGAHTEPVTTSFRWKLAMRSTDDGRWLLINAYPWSGITVHQQGGGG
jgi:hypothetical protein